MGEGTPGFDLPANIVIEDDPLPCITPQPCETCRRQGTWGDGTLVCHEWCDNDGYNAKCADIRGCGAWTPKEEA